LRVGCVLTYLGEVMDIIELAKQAGINSPDGFKLTVNHMATFQLEKFAELVEEAARADEREACAKVCDEQANSEYWEGAYACGRNIRARGTT